MHADNHPTPYADVNATLREFLAQIQAILGDNFRGMYLDGSLALGDFNPESSDIDYIVTTAELVSERSFEALRAMHERFNASASPWATEVEAVYVPLSMLRRGGVQPPWVPRIERGPGVPLVKTQLSSSWILHWRTLREHTVIVVGPDPRPFIDPIPSDDLRRVVAADAEDWLDPSRFNPDELVYRGPQTYIVRTLCRMLYTMECGGVASKPEAARWVLATQGSQWRELIERANAWTKDPARQDPLTEEEKRDTLTFMAYTLARCREWTASPLPGRPSDAG